jgi:hypothetical protein
MPSLPLMIVTIAYNNCLNCAVLMIYVDEYDVVDSAATNYINDLLQPFVDQIKSARSED